VESAPGKGTCFDVYLPQVQEERDSVSTKTASLPSASETLTVLVVEDDNAVRELAVRFLDTAGFRVLAAKDGVEALRIAKENAQAIGALLTDVVMPRMRGTELAARLNSVIPDLKVILMSGYLEQFEPDQEAPAGERLFLEKPFTRESLLHTVNKAFRSSSLAHLKR